MLTEIYIEALLVDKEQADQVWEAWDAGEIDDLSAWTAWLIVALRCNSSNPYRHSLITFRQAAFAGTGQSIVSAKLTTVLLN